MLKYNFDPKLVHCRLQGKGIPVKTNRNIYKMLMSKNSQAKENGVNFLLKLNVLIKDNNVIIFNENEKSWILEKCEGYIPPFLPIYDHKLKKFIKTYFID